MNAARRITVVCRRAGTLAAAAPGLSVRRRVARRSAVVVVRRRGGGRRRGRGRRVARGRRRKNRSERQRGAGSAAVAFNLSREKSVSAFRSDREGTSGSRMS